MRLTLILALVACKTDPTTPGTDTDTDTDVTDTDTDTEVRPDVPGTTPMSSLDAPSATAVCEALDDIAAVTLTCDGAALAYADSPLTTCDTDLAAVPASCALTVDDLFDCAELVSSATCASDFAELPCRALFEPDCAPLGEVAADLLGGPFGLQDPMSLGALSTPQIFGLCLEMTAFAEVTVTCDDTEITIEPSTQSECTEQLAQIPGACGATLADARGCIQEIQSADCDAIFGTSPSCSALQDDSCVP